MSEFSITIHEVIAALDQYVDGKLDADESKRSVRQYIVKIGPRGKEPNNRAIAELRKHGVATIFQTAQDDIDRLVGHVRHRGVELDISDDSTPDND
jgi:hypothetical protein